MLDLATCAAAEQHAEVPCVTASVLDLVFEPDVVATLGDLLVVRLRTQTATLLFCMGDPRGVHIYRLAVFSWFLFLSSSIFCL